MADITSLIEPFTEVALLALAERSANIFVASDKSLTKHEF
jgi:hypothetical protein